MLILLGILVGVLSGLLGVGGGVILVPALVALHYSPLAAVGSSALAVALIALSGTFYNYKKYSFDFKNLIIMALPGILFSQLGVLSATYINPAWLLIFFGLLLVSILMLVLFEPSSLETPCFSPIMALLIVGSSAGFLSGMFGVGGGVILVPLQILLLHFDIKTAIRNSLAIVLIASLGSSLGHIVAGNILFKDSILIGVGGAVGTQIGSRLLPNMNERLTKYIFAGLLGLLALYIFGKAYRIS